MHAMCRLSRRLTSLGEPLGPGSVTRLWSPVVGSASSTMGVCQSPVIVCLLPDMQSATLSHLAMLDVANVLLPTTTTAAAAAGRRAATLTACTALTTVVDAQDIAYVLNV